MISGTPNSHGRAGDEYPSAEITGIDLSPTQPTLYVYSLLGGLSLALY